MSALTKAQLLEENAKLRQDNADLLRAVDANLTTIYRLISRLSAAHKRESRSWWRP